MYLPPTLLSLVFLFLSPVNAQLSLPDAFYIPPDEATGTQAANNSPNSQWSTLLGNLLYFYDEQRSGTLPSSNRVPWRNSSALDDGKDVGRDLTGGFYDAGDYVKYTFPLSFALMSMCWGALDSGKGYELANQTAYLDDTLRWGLNWLIKAHPSPDTLYVQVGDGNLDNVYWGGDRNIPYPRPSYQINSTSPGTDAAAQASAAFSACSALYNNRTLSASSSTSALRDTDYASKLQTHAQDLYAFATHASGGMQTYDTAVPQSGEAYASSGYADELTIAALFLSLSDTSSNATGYYADAVKWYYSNSLNEQLQAGSESTFNWDAKSPGAVVLAAQMAFIYPDVVSGSNATLEVWRKATEDYFDVFLNNKGRSYLTKGGLLYFPGDSDEVSLDPALNVAMLMMRYASSGIATDSEKYQEFAQNQLDYALGKNPMFVPYVVGTHPNSPHNPHSAISTGFAPSDASVIFPQDLDTEPAQETYTLFGGVVGGPDKNDKFWDLRSDWAQNEVALDYNAPLLMLAAHALASGAGDPYYTQVRAGAYDEVRPSGKPCDAAIQCSKSGGLSRGGKIAVGVVVGVVGVLVLGLVLCWLRRLRRNGMF